MKSTTHTFALLAEWITFLWQALPAKLRPTFLELLFGCIISRTGHITDAILAIRPGLFWNSYYKAIEKGSYSWLLQLRQWFMLILKIFPAQTITLVIDDFISVRASKKAPSADLYHDHARRANRPQFLWGQMRVAVGIICSYGKRHAAFPLLLKLMRTTGNTSKLDAACLLMRTILRWIPHERTIRLLLDAWYMKGPLLLDLMQKKVVVIGQVRRDTALYLPPPPVTARKRGRPRKYGERISFERFTELCPFAEQTIVAYGEPRLFQFYTLDLKVRFLKGAVCRVVWCRFLNKEKWTTWHLLLSTDCTISADSIIRLYGFRWQTEPMFNELKNLFGLLNAWQQTRQALARWSTMICLSYGLPRLLSLVMEPERAMQCLSIPWRKEAPVTAGWIARAITHHFYRFPVRALWNRKKQKMQLPKDVIEHYLRDVA